MLSFEELHRTTYGLVLSKNGPLLYNGVRRVLESHLKERVHSDVLVHLRPAGSRMTSTRCEELLSSIRVLWSEHVMAMLLIKDFLTYLDRVYVKTAQLPSVYEMGMCVFRDQVLMTSDRRLTKEVVNCIMFQISQERKEALDEIDRGTLRGVVDMMIELHDAGQLRSLYEIYIEPRLRAETDTYYREVSRVRISELGAPEYVKAAQGDLDSEMDRVKAYLAPSSAAMLRQIVLEDLILNHARDIVVLRGAGLAEMLDQGNIESLRVMYHLFVPMPDAFDVLLKGIYSHILKLGKQIMASIAALSAQSHSGGKGDEDAKQADAAATQGASGAAPKTSIALRWVQDVLLLYDVYDNFLQQSFAENQALRNATKEAFIEVINSNSRAPELLSLFIDDNLKGGLRRKTEQEVDHVLERTVLMFRFLKNKDAFEHYYKLHLAKRLLFGCTISDDAEHNLVSKLKIECGSQFTLKLEGMFKDMQLSSDMSRELRDSDAGSDLDFDLNVSVLTPTFWPTMTPAGMVAQSGDTLSRSEGGEHSGKAVLSSRSSIGRAVEDFTSFYLKFHSSRRLTWQYSMGYADLKVHVGDRTYELNVSTYQMLILMLFADCNDDTKLSTVEIREKTHIPHGALTRHLQSLACGKFRILTKTPMSRDVGPADVFAFNTKFKSPQYRIRIPVVSARNNVESEKEKAATQMAIEQERQYLIEAAVVRIMKARKQMTHEQLVNESIDQLSARFMASPKMIKDVIAKLIDRDYLQRSPDDPRLYIYLA
ncbi:hypothetical protein GGI07_004763 [Coemansia sp. Benny D115]|nr:hypothetical protein GGI07_004763 [Coemansia sp. Benny D115]